jgi:hypothetical protein
MHVHVTVELDGDDLVVVKSASDGGAVARLRTEARRLDRARHPGVVALLDAGPVPCADVTPDVVADAPADEPAEGYALRLAHAGEPVGHWRASVPQVAGVAAAVASTLADLHDLGLVHGRLDPTHVLVGSDGRPRLCGLGEPGDATPEDDVAAWGHLVADLLTLAVDERRGRRARAGARRARAAGRALASICDRATDPVASRRPTARATADAVVAAVPDATLPAGPPSGRRPRGDTLDRIWSYAGEPSEAERWAAAFGDVPDGYAGPSLGDDVEGCAGPALGDDVDPVPAWPAVDDGAPATFSTDDTWSEPDLDDLVLAPDGLGRTTDGHDAAPVAAHDDTATRDHRPVGVVRHPLAPATSERTRRAGGRGRHALAAVAVGVVAVVIGGGCLLLARAARDRGGSPAAADETCPAVDPPAADVDGDGCREPLALDGRTVDAGAARWTLGDAGDVVAVGDWDCDGHATAALLRPSTGDVFHFPTWAAVGERVTVAPVDRVQGATAISADDAADTGDVACDRLVATAPDGTPTGVDVTP